MKSQIYSMIDLGYIHSLSNQKFDEDFQFIFSDFNRFEKLEVFKYSLNLGYIKESLPNLKLDEDFNSYSRCFEILQNARFSMIPW